MRINKGVIEIIPFKYDMGPWMVNLSMALSTGQR